MDEVQFHKYSMKYGALFEAGIGAEAIFEILKKTDMSKLKEELEKELEGASSLEKEKLSFLFCVFSSHTENEDAISPS